jgi:hypothetical protein
MAAVVWLLLIWLGFAPLQVRADAMPVRISGSMPVRSDALSSAEFNAIVAEATDISRQPHKGFIAPLPASWRTLTRDKLAAMLVMPGFGQIPSDPRGVLTDQAATWDMFTFTRPSDAAQLWNRLWPPGADLRPNSGGRIYTPDPTWSPESAAMTMVFSCLPASIWNAPEDPQVLARRKNLGWQWGNYSRAWNGMHLCVSDEVMRWGPKSTNTALEQVSSILRRKFGDQLMSDGCSRSGPDDCLVLLQALYGLDKDDKRLPVILKHIEPSFALDKAIEIPGIDPNADSSLLDAPRAEALRRLSFLTLKLPVLLHQVHASPPGEFDRTVRQAMVLTIVAARLRGFSRFGSLFDPGDSADPWQWLGPAQQAVIAASMGKLGADYAGKVGCDLSRQGEQRGAPSFWQGYVVENIRLGHGDCDDRQVLGLSSLVTSEGSVRERLVAALQPIAAELTTEGPFREHALDEVEAACKKQRSHTLDPFNLCAGVAARAAAQAASQPPVDPLECGSDVIVATAEALHFMADESFWTRPTTACRLDPMDKGRAIVALTYRAGEEKTGQELTTSEPDAYDLDLAIVDLATGNIISHIHEPAAIPHDAVTFDRLTIDTGRYILASGKRAFGIRIDHSAHCHDCLYETTELELYLPNGRRLQKILNTVVDETQSDPTNQCPDGAVRDQATLSIGNGENHGLADLILSTVTTLDNACGDKDAKPEQATSRKTLTLRFDGHRYPIPVP